MLEIYTTIGELSVMDVKQLKRKFTKMHAPFPFLIMLVITTPWGITLFQEPSIYNRARWAGLTALFFFLLAFTLYLCLLAIRKIPLHQLNRVKRRLVLFTRKFIQFHYPAAMIGLFWILLHAYWMGRIYEMNLKSITGILTIIALAFVILTGYLRKQKSSGKRRRFHRYASYLFLVFVSIHLLV
jgi:hypothetical protein